jgi:glutamate/tyrosine decarboxylase-like PLP-dependent enzyme
MNQRLQDDRDNYAAILNRTAGLAISILERQADTAPGRLIAPLPTETLTANGLGAEKTIELFGEKYADKIAASAGPRYFGFVTGGSTPASVAGDWLVSAMDQNACGSQDSIAPRLEHQTIDLLKQLFGLDADYYGTFVTGATMSNLVSLAQARQWIGLQHGKDFSSDGADASLVKVLSGTAHSSVVKSLSMLGIGRNALLKVPVLSDREAVDVKALEDALKKLNGPVVVVANAGTVNTVDFDDLVAIGELKKKYPFWLHVDAAFGGFAALSGKYKHLVAGINAADSITIDAHKWLNVPYDSAMQFTRHRKIQLQVFQNSAAYLGDPEESPDYFHYTPENSRRWRSLPAWFSLMAYGSEGHREIVERNCEAAAYFAKHLLRSGSFRLLAPARMNVVCFTLAGESTMEELKHFLNAVRDDGNVFFTPTVYKGTPAIRAAISNWQTTKADMDVALEVIERLANNHKDLRSPVEQTTKNTQGS